MSDEARANLVDWLNAFKADPFSTGADKVDRLLAITRTEPSTVTDEGLVERTALALCKAYDRLQRETGQRTGALTAYRAGSMAVEFWDEMAQAALEASGHTALLREIEAKDAALREARDKMLGAVEPDDVRVLNQIDAALSRPLVGGNNPKP